MEAKKTERPYDDLLELIHEGHRTVLRRLRAKEPFIADDDSKAAVRIYRACYETLKRWGAVEEASLTQLGSRLLVDRPKRDRPFLNGLFSASVLFLSLLLPLDYTYATDWQTTSDGKMRVTTECFCDGSYELIVRGGTKGTSYYIGSYDCFDLKTFRAVKGVPLAKMSYVISGSCEHFFIATDKGKVRVLALRVIGG